MSSLCRSTSLTAAALACAFCCVAADSPAKPTKEQIAQWVRQLGDDDFSTREAASKKLYEAGQAAESALQEAAGSDDAEVARRASEILDKFKWGLYPDAPRKSSIWCRATGPPTPTASRSVITELLDGRAVRLPDAAQDRRRRRGSGRARRRPTSKSPTNCRTPPRKCSSMRTTTRWNCFWTCSWPTTPDQGARPLRRLLPDARQARRTHRPFPGASPARGRTVSGHGRSLLTCIMRRATSTPPATRPTRPTGPNWPTPCSSRPATGRNSPTGRSTPNPTCPMRSWASRPPTAASPATPKVSTDALADLRKSVRRPAGR